MKHTFTFISIFCIIFTLWITPGCEKFDEVPAYLQIDTILMTTSTNYPGFSPSSQIVDAWISVDGVSLGAFQLPACIPVLAKGEHEITIGPGILVNGLSLRRGQYPFYNTIKVKANLVEDSTTNITRNANGTVRILTTFNPNTFYPRLNETFEDRLSFDTANQSKTIIQQVSIASVPVNTPSSLYGNSVGFVHMTTEENTCFLLSKERFILPYGANSSTFVEVDYCGNTEFVVGIQSFKKNMVPIASHTIAIGNAQKSMQWKKIYINIGSRVNEDINAGAIYFKIFVATYLAENQSEASMYFDNIRLVQNSKPVEE